MNRSERISLFGALLLLVVLALYSSYALRGMESRGGPLTEPVELEMKGMQQDFLTTSWTSARGTETVTTFKRSDETDAQLQTRHDARVAIAQAANPPV